MHAFEHQQQQLLRSGRDQLVERLLRRQWRSVDALSRRSLVLVRSHEFRAHSGVEMLSVVAQLLHNHTQLFRLDRQHNCHSIRAVSSQLAFDKDKAKITCF